MSEYNQSRRKPIGEPWTVTMMLDAIARKGAHYTRSRAFTSLLGVTTVVGKTAIITVREGMPDSESVRVLAHELGHLALGHCSTRPTSGTIAGLMRGQYDEVVEKQVDIWAAHLLVDPQVYEQAVALHTEVDAVHDVAQTLALPDLVVKTWLETRGVTYDMNPREWFYSDGHWFDMSPAPLDVGN